MATEPPTLAPAALAERARVLRILRAQAPRLRARGITQLSLFGSMARGAAGPESDIDLFDRGRPRSPLRSFRSPRSRGGTWPPARPSHQLRFSSEMRPWLLEWIEEDRIGIY